MHACEITSAAELHQIYALNKNLYPTTVLLAQTPVHKGRSYFLFYS
jgi:hypothetical protein